ncbi:MAG: glutamate--tRNA ligase, partial [Bryocella sp.]
TFAANQLATLEATAWELESITNALKALGETEQWSVKENFMLLRAILSGSTQSPPLVESMLVFGKSRCLDRMRRFLEHQKLQAHQRK